MSYNGHFEHNNIILLYTHGEYKTFEHTIGTKITVRFRIHSARWVNF